MTWTCFGRDAVGHRDHLVDAVADDHLAVVAPRASRRVAGRKERELAFDLGHRVVGELLGAREQDGGRGGPVLGLAQQVGRAQLTVHRLVGDHQRLGGTREEIDAHPAEELALGLRDEHVARADEHVDRIDGLGAERHSAHRLHPAETADLVGATEILGDHDGRIRLAFVGRRAGDDPLHPRHLRRDHAHVGGGDHGVLATRHVGADAVDGNVPVPEDHPGHRLLLHVAERALLNLRKVANLTLCEFDVGPLPRADPLVAGIDRGPAQPEFLRRPAVEPFGVLAHRGIAAPFDGSENVLDGPTHLRVGIGPGVLADPGLQVSGHRILLPLLPLAAHRSAERRG